MDLSANSLPQDTCIIRLEGYEGPLDMLLELARAQKVDLSEISVLQLVEQYLSAIADLQKVRLELAADWLVMAAWLAWLKSRLLLPQTEEEQVEGEEAAESLQMRLIELARISQVAQWLEMRPQLGQDVFARGDPDDLTEIDRSSLLLDMASLVRAYLGVVKRIGRKKIYTPRQLSFWTVQDALARLRAVLKLEKVPDWHILYEFVPSSFDASLEGMEVDHLHKKHRAAIAGTLLASLEMARDGLVELRQEEDFGAILLRHQLYKKGEIAVAEES